MCYVKFAKFFFLWDSDNGERYLTTCECPPFITCGCLSLKVRLQLLPRITLRNMHWTFELYVLRAYTCVSFIIPHHGGLTRKFFSWGFSERRHA